MTLTPEQMDEAVKEMAEAMCAPFSPDETIYLGGYMKRWESHKEDAHAALLAALPVIRRAVLEEAAAEAERYAHDSIASQHICAAYNIARHIRALGVKP